MGHYNPRAFGLRIVLVNHRFDRRLQSPDDLLDAYHTLTGWSDAAAAQGHQVTVVQAFSAEATRRRGSVDYVFCTAGPVGTRALARMHRRIADLDPDTVHVNGLDVPLHVWQLRRQLPRSVALVVQDHGTIAPAATGIKPAIRRRAMRAADAFLFTAREQAASWVERRFVAERTVHEVLEASTRIVPVDRARARASAGITGAPAVLWVGRLIPDKDPLTVIAAFERLLDVVPTATLTMVFGEATLRPDIEARIRASKPLARAVWLVGHVPYVDMASFYSAADLFVLGSRRESCGYALLEACACGLMPIVTDIPSFRVLTGNGAIGALWRPGDVHRCAAALVHAARSAGRADDDRRARVRAHFASHLSWDQVGRRASAIYEQVLCARRGPEDGNARATLGTSPCRAEPSTSNASNTTERPSSMR
jgi:glycosyltransferase involved in cell wall biosynthesis